MLMAKVKRGIAKIRRIVSVQRFLSACSSADVSENTVRDLGPFLQFPLNSVMLKARRSSLKNREHCS